ncbi:MAG: hypothetical protein ABR936_05590 [Bacteroidota bacterium]|jgi:hypothetical protein
MKDKEVGIPIIGSMISIGFTMHDPDDTTSHPEFVDVVNIYYSNQKFEDIAGNEDFEPGFERGIYFSDSLRNVLTPSPFDWLINGRDHATPAKIIIWDEWKGLMGENECGASIGNSGFTTAASFERAFVFRYLEDGTKIVATYYFGPLPYDEKHHNPSMDLLVEDFKRIVESIQIGVTK